MLQKPLQLPLKFSTAGLLYVANGSDGVHTSQPRNHVAALIREGALAG
jgi:hypothetical protein